MREVEKNDLSFPLLLRSPGFHAGHHFLRVDRAEELSSTAEQLPRDELMAIEYLDARRGDGNIRKYRAVFIDGHLYPLHLAISRAWKIHYYNADMTNHPKNQAEEAEFLDNMPRALGAKAMNALEQIQLTLGLDFGGIDFSLREDGSVLVFEANATMNIILPGSDRQWDYRRAAIGRALSAARTMLMKRIGVSC